MAASTAALLEGRIEEAAGRAARTSGHPRRRRRAAGGGAGHLANSVDGFAAPKGLPWQPDRREVYTSVAFVLAKHVEMGGKHLIVRTPAADPVAAAAPLTASAAPAAVPTQPTDASAGTDASAVTASRNSPGSPGAARWRFSR